MLRKRIKKLLSENYFFKSFLILTTSSALAQVINFCFYPIISRLYLPTEFGVLAAFTSVIGILTSFTTGQYELAIPTVKRNAEAKQIVKVANIFSFFFAMFFALLLVIFKTFLPNAFHGFFQKGILWLIPLSIILLNGYCIFTIYYVKFGRLNLIFKTKIYQVLSKNSLQIAGGLFFTNKVVFLVLGVITSQSTGLFSFLKHFHSKDSTRFKRTFLQRFKIEKERFTKYSRKFKNYPIYLIPAGILNKVGLELPVLFFSVYYGSKFTGFYSMANQIVLLPVGIIMQSLSRTYLNEFSSRYNASKQNALAFYRGFNLRIIKWTLVPCILFCIAIRPFAELFLGGKWHLSAQMMQYFVVFGYFQLVYSTISQTLNVINRHSTQLKWNIFRTIVIITSFAVCYRLKLEEILVFKFYIAEMIIFYIILGQLTLSSLKRDVASSVNL